MNRLKRLRQHIKDFSLRFVLVECLNSIDYQLLKLARKPLSLHLHQWRKEYVIRWLTSHLSSLIDRYQHQIVTQEHQSNEIIWMCWMQGADNAPDFVRRIIANVRAHAGSRQVIVLSEQSIPQYCQLPVYIMDKYHKGVITPQQLTDIIRADLLARRGGLWIDATVLICQDIPQYVFELPFFSVKDIDNNYPSSRLVVDGTKWESYLIASQPHSITAMFLRDALFEYWKNMDTIIDYFLVFYLAKMAREQIPAAALEYDSIPGNNRECELLDPFLLKRLPFNQEDWDRFFASSTFAYKLSWKYPYPTQTKHGQFTLSAHLPWAVGR